MSMPHPAFELYDSVGPTTEPVAAHRENRPGADDLHRWTAHDAREFTAPLPAEDAGQRISDRTRHLYRVRTAAELNTVAQDILGNGHSGLAELHLFPETAAKWRERNQEPASLSKAVNTRRTSSTAPAGRGSKTAMRTQPRQPFPSRQV
ncbi:hypothetical protein ACHZ98_29320 [Streptomyces sp. MAR4 CNY-716]